MPKITTVTVGAGRDYASIAAMVNWLKNRDLVANDEVVIAECYDDITSNGSIGVFVQPKTHSENHYCIIRPAPGLSVNDYDPDGLTGFGTQGLLMKVVLSTYAIAIRPGIALHGWRIESGGNAADDTEIRTILNLGSAGNRRPEFKYNRVLCKHTGANARLITTGEDNRGGVITDNAFFQGEGNGYFVNATRDTWLMRNTFIRSGAAAGTRAVNGLPITAGGQYCDNVFVGCGSQAATGLPATETAVVHHNFADSPISGNSGGFTIATAGSLLGNPTVHGLPKSGGPLIGAASSSAYRTKDMVNKYRGTAADVGAFQLIAQQLPALVVAKITSQVVTDQSIVIKGTTTNDVMSGTATLSLDGKVAAGPKTVTLSKNAFEVSFDLLTPGSYAAPVITFTNDGGVSQPASSAAAFVIAAPVKPTAVVKRQIRIGQKLVVKGTYEKSPRSGTIALKAAATPNGASDQGPVNVTLYPDGTFMGVLENIPFGNYLAPEIHLNNAAGIGDAATGVTPVVVADVVLPPSEGVRIYTIGNGREFTSIGAFYEYMSGRDLVALQEKSVAYVFDDQLLTGVISGNAAYSNGEYYCLICPAPGMGVNDIFNSPDEQFDYGYAGIELSMLDDKAWRTGRGMHFEGFRWNLMQSSGSTSSPTILLGYSTSSNPTPLAFRRNRVKGSSIVARPMLQAGIYSSRGQVTDNVFIHEGASNTGPLVTGSKCSFLRNTFVRRGTSTGGVAMEAGGETYIESNLLLGCSATPISIGSVDIPTVKLFNNMTDVALASVTVGLTYGANLVENISNDLRPRLGTPAIGGGSTTARGIPDIIGGNRGPQPDVGAFQRNVFIPLVVGVVKSQVLDGNDLIISGTANNGADSGMITLPVDAVDPGNAIARENVPVTINANGTFDVRLNDLAPGNYASPVITFINEGGVSLPATGVSSVKIIEIGGDPQAGGNGGEILPPTVSIGNKSINGRVLTMSGTVNLRGDSNATLELFIDPLPSGATVGPLAVNVSEGQWTYQGVLNYYDCRVRVVATANGTPQFVSADLSIARATGAMAAPLR